MGRPKIFSEFLISCCLCDHQERFSPSLNKSASAFFRGKEPLSFLQFIKRERPANPFSSGEEWTFLNDYGGSYPCHSRAVNTEGRISRDRCHLPRRKSFR